MQLLNLYPTDEPWCRGCAYVALMKLNGSTVRSSTTCNFGCTIMHVPARARAFIYMYCRHAPFLYFGRRFARTTSDQRPEDCGSQRKHCTGPHATVVGPPLLLYLYTTAP